MDQATFDVICERVAAGEALRVICRDMGIKSENSVRQFARQGDGTRMEQWKQAQQDRAHTLADQLMEIASDGRNDWMASNDPNNPGWRVNGEHINRSRLRVYTAQWLASKLLPKEYGDKLHQEHTGAGGGAIKAEIQPSMDMSKLTRDERDQLRKLMMAAMVTGS